MHLKNKMKKSAIIATCLVNSDMVSTIEQAESSVRGIFTDEYPHLNFNQWNEEVSYEVAQDIIKNVGRASRINVEKFIEDLTN